MDPAAILRQGARVWNEWREEERAEGRRTVDLEGLNLSGLRLNGGDLLGVNIRNCDFSGVHLANLGLHAEIKDAIFTGAQFDNVNARQSSFKNVNLRQSTLVEVEFTWARLDVVDLSESSITRCDFVLGHLERVSFQESRILATIFSRTNLTDVDFTDAILSITTFAATSLKNVRGIDTAHTTDTNSIGIDTFFASGGISDSFLRSAGVPDVFIAYASSLTGKAIEYYSCFISYSSRDEEFARRLHADLQAGGIRTWFAPEDMKTGDRIRARLDESIRLHDKLVLILSESSMASDWVEQEVERALERERREKKDVLFPLRIDDSVFDSKQAWAADVRTKHIGDFTNWKSHDDYTKAFDRLVRDLKKSQPPIVMR